MSTLRAEALLDTGGGETIPFVFPQSVSLLGFKPRVARIQIYWPEGFSAEPGVSGQISISVTKSKVYGRVGTIIGEASSMSSIVQHSSGWRNDMAQVMTWEYHIDTDEEVYPGSLFISSYVSNTVNDYKFGITLFGRYFNPTVMDVVRSSLSR